MKVTFKTTDFEQSLYGCPKEIIAEDTLKTLIDRLERKEKAKQYLYAKEILNEIKDILNEPESWGAYKIEEEYCRTLLAVHKMIRANPIRLKYDGMDISGYLKLLANVKARLFNTNPSVINQRITVAEEMSKLGLFPQMITERWQLRHTKAPNRAFMDILLKVRPDFAQDDILRREYSKLNVAWQRKDENALNEIREKIKELGGIDISKDMKED